MLRPRLDELHCQHGKAWHLDYFKLLPNTHHDRLSLRVRGSLVCSFLGEVGQLNNVALNVSSLAYGYGHEHFLWNTTSHRVWWERN